MSENSFQVVQLGRRVPPSRHLHQHPQSAVYLPLSTCQSVAWMAEISLGTPPQRFTVGIDTASSDLWVPSVDCLRCDAFTGWNKYNATESSTHHSFDMDFQVTYKGGAVLEGQYARDVLTVKNIEIANQQFAQVTSITNYQTCANHQGSWGLAPSSSSLQALHVREGIFSIYLDPIDAAHNPSRMETTDEYGNVQFLENPVSTESELLLGGIHQRHYDGCLTWHPLVESSSWTVAIHKVQVGSLELMTNTVATIGSASPNLIGSHSAVGALLEASGAECYDVINDELEPVECRSPYGFDVATTDCEGVFYDIQFIANGETYTLTKNDMLLRVPTGGPEDMCLFRIAIDDDVQGWVLGDVFLGRYYAAFDSVNSRIGLARSSKNSDSVCQADAHLDVEWNAPHDSTGLGQGPKLGIAVAGVLAVLLAFVCVILVRRRKQTQKAMMMESSEENVKLGDGENVVSFEYDGPNIY